MTARRQTNMAASDTNSTVRSDVQRRCDRPNRESPRRADSLDVRRLPSAEVRRNQTERSPKRNRSNRRHTNLPELITSSRGASSYSSGEEVKYSLNEDSQPRNSCHSCGHSTVERRPTQVPMVSRSQNFLKGLSVSHEEENETNKKIPFDQPVNKTLTTTTTLDTKDSQKIFTEVYRLPVFRWIDLGLRKGLWRLSSLLILSPTLLIVIPLLLTAISSVGLILRRENLSPQLPFTSYYSTPASVAHLSQLHFNTSNPRYDAISRLAATDFAVLIETRGDENILKEEIIDQYVQLKKRIEGVKVRQGDRFYDYLSLCRRTGDSCEVNVVERLLARKIGFQLRYPEISTVDHHSAPHHNDTKLFVGSTFGGVEKDPEGNMAGAKSLAMYFRLGSDESEELIRLKWQAEFDSVVKAAAANINATVHFWSFEAFSAEVIRQFRQIHGCLAISLGILIVSLLSAHASTSCYASRPWLGVAAVITILTAMMSAVGVVVGGEGKLLADVAAFLLFATGSASFLLLDLLKSWRKFSNVAVDPAEKIRFLFTCDLPGPILTSIVCAVAMGCTGLTSTIPLLRQMCSLTAVFLPLLAIATALLYASAVFLTGRREAAGLRWYRCCNDGDTNFPSKILHSSYLYKEMRRLQRRLYNDRRSWDKSVGRSMASASARYAAILVFVVYLIFTIYGCIGCRPALDELNFLPNDTESQRFLHDYRQLYGQFDRYVELFFDDPATFSDLHTIESVVTLVEDARRSECVGKTVSWLMEYLEWAKKFSFNLTPENFVTFLQHEFLEKSENKKFRSDLIFTTFHSNAVISASRMYLELSEKKCADPLPFLQSLTTMAKSYGISLTLKSPATFLLRHDLEVQSSIVGTLAIFIGSAAVASLLVIAQPTVALLVTLMLSSIAAGTYGFGYFWSLDSNMPNFATVSMGLTYSLTTILLFCYHYINAHPQDSSSRLEYVFQSSLMSLLKSTAILLLCATPLLAVKTGMVEAQLKILLIEVLITDLHILLFLPPCLSLLTLKLPERCSRRPSDCVKFRCCSSEEDASSIYYITAKQPQLNAEFVQKFFQEKFREDILTGSSLQNTSSPAAKPHQVAMEKQSESPSLSLSHATSEQQQVDQPKIFRTEQHVKMEIPTPKDKRSETQQLSEIPEEPKPTEAEEVERKIYVPKKYRDGAKTVSHRGNRVEIDQKLFTGKPQTVSKRQGQDLSQLFRDQYRDALKSDIDLTAKPTENFYATIPDPKGFGHRPSGKHSTDTASSHKKSSSDGSDRQQQRPVATHVNVIDVSDGDLTSSSDAKSTSASTTESVYIVVESGETGKKELRKVENAARRSRTSFVDDNHLGNKVSFATWNEQPGDYQQPIYRQSEPDRIVFAVPMPQVFELRPEWRGETWLHGTVRQHNHAYNQRPNIFNLAQPEAPPHQYFNRTPFAPGLHPADDQFNPEFQQKLTKQTGKNQKRSATVRIK